MAFSAMSGIFLIVAVFMSAGNAFANICDGGNDHMCVDWSFGSQRMALAQLNYKQRTGEDVLFGMGSYGGPDDENMGKCYKFTTDTADVPFIAQVTNQGVDIEANQFDMQMGAGGFGIFNGCADPTDRNPDDDPCGDENRTLVNATPMFPGGQDGFGARCGGHTTRSGCSAAPNMPSSLSSLPSVGGTVEPTLQVLCERAFDWGARSSSGDPNARIISGGRVPCPEELRDITNLARTDENSISDDMMAPDGTLTSTMDCCAPASSNSDLVPSADPAFPRTIPCQSDGYTRVADI